VFKAKRRTTKWLAAVKQKTIFPANGTDNLSEKQLTL